jgi:hypothetical protein
MRMRCVELLYITTYDLKTAELIFLEQRLRKSEISHLLTHRYCLEYFKAATKLYYLNRSLCLGDLQGVNH